MEQLRIGLLAVHKETFPLKVIIHKVIDETPNIKLACKALISPK